MAKEKEVAASEKARQAQAQSSPARPSQSAERGMGRPQGETNRNNANVAAAGKNHGIEEEVRRQNKVGQKQQPMVEKPNTADKHLPRIDPPQEPPAPRKPSNQQGHSR